MRVLVLTNLYPPNAYGGYELSCCDVAERLAARGHDVFVVTSDHRSPSGVPAGIDRGIPVRRSLPLTWEHGRVPPAWRRPGIERRALRDVRGAIENHKSDVVSVWNPSGLPGGLLGWLARMDLPVVWVLADAWPERVMAGDPWLAPLHGRPRLARVLSALTGVPTSVPDVGVTGTLCFCSRDLRDRVGAAVGWSVDGAVVTPLGVDLGDFPLMPSRTRRWGWRLLFVGRLDPTKGIDTLVRALPLLPDEATLRIIAPPEAAHLARVRSLAASLGVERRIVIESAPRRELRAAYRSADVCVFPSEWAEPFGLVPLEAMACGTPVVATGTGGSGEYLRDGVNSLLYAAGDPRLLAAAVQEMSGDPSLRARLVAGGMATAGRLTVDRLADQLEEVYRRVADRRR